MKVNYTARGLWAWWVRSWSSGGWAWKMTLATLSLLWVTGLANALWFVITGGSAILLLPAALSVLGVVVWGPSRARKPATVSLLVVGALGLMDIMSPALEFIFAAQRPELDAFETAVMAIVMTVFVVGIVGLLLWFLKTVFIPFPSYVEKHAPDVLGDADALNDVSQALSHADGVYAGDVFLREGLPSQIESPIRMGLTGQENPTDITHRALRASIEDRAVVIGPPGTGKTAFLVSQILDWAQSRRSMVVLDIKPEIFGITQAALRKQGYEVITYNPTAQTGLRYNPLDDVEGPEALGEMAAALIPSATAEDAVFNESARDFLDAVVTHLTAVNGATSLPEMRDWIADFSGYKALMRELAQSPAGDARGIAKNLMMTAANERLLGSIFATFQSNLRFLRYPAVRDSLLRSEFSLKQLTGSEGKPVALFLQFEEQHRETTARLMAFMLGHVLRYLITHSDRDAVLLLFDEIGSAPVVPGLVTKLNTIRSRKMPLWMYWQSIEQMQVYGHKANEGANTILGACDVQMVFRLNDNASAEWMSQRIGVIDRQVTARSVGHRGGDGFGWTQDISKSLVKEPVIFAHELQALRRSEVLCTYRGHAWRGVATPYFEHWTQYANHRPDALTGAPYEPIEMAFPMDASDKKLAITEPAA